MVTEAPARNIEILTITLAFYIIACVAVALRCYVRASLLRAFGSDDILAVLSLLLLSGGIVLCLLGTSSGFGQHVDDMTMERYLHGIRYWYCLEVCYPFIICFIKSSIAVYLLRIAVKPIHIYTIVFPTLLFILYSAGLSVFLLLQCRPFSLSWERYIGVTEGHCEAPSTISAVAYGHAALGVLTDITLGAIPAFIVAELQISNRTKLAVAITLGLGSTASVCTLVRIAFIKDLITPHDYLYAISDIISLSIVETAVALTAACLATLKPLVTSFLDWSEKSKGSKGGQHMNMTENMGRTRIQIHDATEICLRPDLELIGFTGYTTTIISSGGQEAAPRRNVSLKRTVEVQTETWSTSSPGESLRPHTRLGSERGVFDGEEQVYHIL